MAANELTVRKRVTEILNACAPGTFSEAVDMNYFDRNSLAIRQAVKEAALMIARAILMNPNHVHRGAFVDTTPVTFTHAAEMPDMAGEPDLIQIQPYSGADWITGMPRDVQQIEAYRANSNSLYSGINHDQQNSPLGGYYAVANGRFYHTGHAARAFIPVITSATVTGKVPDEYEPTWVSLATGLTVKEGDNLFPVAQYYFNIGVGDLQAVTAMGTVRPAPSPEAALQARGDT